MIYVSSLQEMPAHVRNLRPSHLVSLTASRELPPTPTEIPAERHLRIAMDDITEPFPGCITPEAAHITSLLQFFGTWKGEAPLLVHCVAGISRSTAAALIAFTHKAPGCEAETAQLLRRLAPHAHPNRRMIALADELLGCEGRLIQAREAMGPAVPMVSGPLIRLPLSI